LTLLVLTSPTGSFPLAACRPGQLRQPPARRL